MGKIKKSPTERHNATASPAITQYIESATAVPLHELPAKLNSFALHWPFPRGDLYHWIPLLDRFDHILEIFNKEYALNLGPQIQPFARRVLEKGDAEEGKPQPAHGAQEKELDAAGFGHDGDRELVENILRFTRVLLERCGNRSLYASSGHINDLLHTTSLDLLQACLQVSLKLAQRYQVARAKNSHPAAQSTLLANHYNISLDSMHRLASPLPRPRIIASSSTPSSAKVKEKASAGPAYNPTDLVALAKDTYSPLARKELAAVSFTYVAKKLLKQEDNQHDDEAFARDPASPTTSRHSRPGTEEVLETVVKPRDSYFPIPTQATFDLSASEVAEKDIHVLVQEHIQQVPKVAQYDLLHRLRVAKTFATHASTRQLLDIRLLAISNLAYALEGNKFQELIGQPDTEEPRRYHLAPQLCDLLQPSSDGQSSLPIKAETTVLETLEALARCRHKNAEVTDALAVTVNHGVLYYELRRAVASLKTDPDVVDAEVLSKIQWRSAIFDLITTISQFSHQIRCAEKMVSAGIMEILVDALRIQSASAERVYDKVIGFISSFTHGIAAAFPALTNARGFEAITQLASQQVTKSLTYVKEANGAVNDLKSKVVDYSIPYHQQATLRSIFKFIIYLFENSSGTHDRLLRNLLDSPQTLGALQQIIANADIFGSNVWDAAIHTVSDFIHNEPTSFQVIAEAGLARGILEAVTQRTILSSDPAPIVDSDHITVINGQIQLPEAKGILPASETIVNIPNAFGAICLNEDGMNLFQSSGALDAYFDVFLSPNHVKALEEESGTAFTIGNTFDELSRHHPGLQEQILTAVIRMLKRVRSLGELLAPLSSSVLYPLSLKFQKEDEPMAGDASTLSNRANHREIFNRAPATPYISACFKFLEGFFHNSTMCQKFCRKGAAEVVIDLITSPANPYDMNVFPMIAKMATVVSRMCEEKPHLVVPSVVQRTNLNLNTLKDLISSSGESSYFKGFVAESTDVQLDGGRDLARAMVNVSVLSSILAKVFTTPAFTARNASTTHLLQSLTFADVYANLVDQLGKLHGACVWESLALTQRIPELWKPFTSSELLHVRNVDSDGAIHITHNCAHCKFDGMAERDDLIINLDDDLRLFAFKNMRMLRFVLNQVPLHIESFFQSLAVALPPKRNTDHQQKQHAALVAEHLAQALVDGLRYRKFLEFSQLDHLRYVNMVLSAVAKILLRTASSLENIAIKEAVTLVLLKFVDAGGLERINDCLQLAGDIVRKTPSDSPDEEAKASEEGAQEVLATILGFYSHITRNKCITDSANLSALVNRRSDNADYFVPSQFLVEIRYKVLASVFPLWSSDAMSKLRANSVKLVIETLQNILKGDNEDRALKRSDNAVKKVHGSSGFKCHNPTNFGKVSEGITDRDLAWEAIVRCNNNDTNALEYCRLHLENGDMPRFPLPAGACDLETSTQPVTSDDTAEPSITAGGSSSAEPVSTSREVDGSDQTMSDDENYGSLGPLPDDVARQDLAVMGGVAGLMQLAMLNENTLPDGAQTAGAEVVAEEPFLTVDDLEEEREKVRVDLIDKCLDVLSATPTVTFALSDLIQAAVARTGESANPRAEIGKTLVSSLMSLQEDDADAETGAKISAYAHLVALILQDRDFFDSTLDELKEYFESLISWIELRNDQKAENKPWIETILLIMERVLAEDEQPAAIEWTPPPADNPLGKPIELVGTVAAPIVPKELRRKLFAAIFNIVPKIGKDQSLALSISRVLVILTRDHQLAAQTRDKQCMSRLFLMVRQLGRALGDKLQTSILIILRHCIEDADSIRQTIRVEIKTAFESSRSGSRGMDLNSYIRNLSHLVLRNPHIFAEVTQELVEIHGFNGNTHKSQHLALKRQVAPTTENDSAVPVGDVVSPSKTSDVRPIVESSDGVIQFLLRELSNYKEVEDKPPSLKLNIEAESNKAQEISASNEGASSQTENKSERQSFKPDEHVIYIYRCFIMQCLAELVACYSHTKTEFINFSRRGEAQVSTPSKPRSGTINYLLNQLLPVGTLEHRDDIAHRKKVATSDWATTVLVALCSQTHEKPYYERHPSPDSLIEREDPDLAFVRRFVLEHAIKSFKDALASTEPQEMRYSRLLAFADLFERLLNAKPDRENPVPTAIFARSSLQVGRLMYEKNFIATLTASIAELDLNYPNAKRVVKHILGPIKTLTDLAVELSQRGEISSSGPGSSTDDEDISSATSVSGQQDSDEEREQTPDLFRNSALSMFESSAGHDDDSESSDEEDEDDDQEMFDAGFEEEVDFEDGNGETISDEDEDLDGMEGVGDEDGDVHYDVEIIDENDEDADESDDEHGDEDDDGEDDDMDGDDDQDMDDEDDDDADDHEEYLQNMEEITGDNENASHDGLDGHIWQEHDDEDEELPRILSPPILHHRPLEHLAEALGADVGEGHGLIGLDIGGARAELFEDEMMPGDEDDDEEEYEADVAYEPEVEEDDEAAARWGFDFIPPPPQSARGTRHERALLDMFNQMSDLQHRTQTINHTLGLHRGGRNHHHHHQRRAEEGGSHPLLQRNDNGPARRDADHMPPVIVGGQDIFGQGGHVHDIMWAINQHAHNHEGVSRLTVTMGPNGEVQPSFGRRFSRLLDVDPSHHWREQIPMPFVQTRQRQTDEAQAVDFKPAFTFIRWQEEAQILYGGKAAEKATRVFHTLLSILLPPAMEDKRLKDIVEAEQKAEEKAREDQRKAEAEKAEREAKEKIEREEREAAEAEAAARARSEAEHNPQSDPDTQMTGADDAAPNTEAAAPSTAEAAPTERVTTTIRGREVDITNLGIDPAYLQALPEEFREEVIMGQFHEQRTQAQESGEAPNEISREFLEALPADLQQELLRQEAQERRRRERAAENERRAAERSNAQAPAQAQDMETIDFLATLDPITRQQILMDVREDPSYMNSLPEEVQQEALALFGERRGERAIFGGRFDDAEGARSLGARMREQLRDNPTERPRAKPVVQMLDKAGVATLLRLMFVSLSYKPKNSLHSILSHVCKNTQNRAEVISILLSILQDGTTDVGAVERSFAHLSLRAKQNGAPKTPQPLKRTPTGQVIQPVTELSPLNIVQHCLGTLTSLATDNPKVQTFFLSEHETVSSQKGKGAKKLKSKENKATKYPLNALLTLLDRKLITDNTGVMETLASLLSRVTLPLQILLKRAKEAQDAQDAETAAKAEAADTENAGVDQGDVMETSVADVRMAEAATVGAGTEPDGEKDEDTEEAGEKKKRSTRELEPPNVPEENIRLVVNILAARECPSKTFSDTLDIIKHMAAIPGAREVFGRELIRQAQELGISVATDLVDLAKHINGASSGTDIQGMALASFSSSGSKQRKLLRILVALDHLFDPKRLQALPRSSLAGDSKLKEDILATLYESQTFQSLWNTLSSCLTAIRERGDMVNVATILLPLIESLMVVCRNSALKDAPLGASQTEVSASTPPPETRMEELFFRFTEEHRKILNELIRNNPKLMNGNLSILAKNSKVLEFDNKRSYFNRKLHNKGSDVRVAHPTLTLNVRRETVFIDSYKMLYYKSGEEIKNGKLNIRFTGEEGIDAGGVSREWFAVMARQMFDGHYALFVPVASDRTTFHPNPTSSINEQHLSYFKFIGRVIGKALYEGRVLDCHFTRAVYRRILGKSVSLKDMETLDLDYYKSLVWILENDITDITFETFSVEVDNFGSKDTIDLVPDGRNIAVTEDNKQEYVRLLVEHRLIKSVQEQLESFLGGFFDVIPSELVSIFNEQELELLISGLPDIDVDDWKNNTDYHNYQANSPQIQWFWRAVKSFDPEERAKLLQFVTGTSKVPLNGFKELEGMNGFAKFNIHRDYGSKEKLPTSHTCFNQLDLPEYESYEHLRQQLYTAITAGSEYFGFA